MKERKRIEDALKHLYKQERSGEKLSPESLAGALSLDLDRCTDLLRSLSARGLLEWQDTGYRLTEAGKKEALKLIRAHRIYETWLADQREHALDDEEIRRLDAALGYPRFDPHGDPIPTEHGTLPALEGKSLLALRPGEVCEVIHVEDEPARVYTRIVQARIGAGTLMEVLARDEQGLDVRLQGGTARLDEAMAANLTVMPLDQERSPDPDVSRLSDLAPGEEAVVHGLASTCRGPERNRLLDLGVVPGAVMRHEYRGPFGNPVAYSVRGALVALRREQADRILIRRSKKEVAS
jgi:DtxR family Mn-dependent transcriptional regulator